MREVHMLGVGTDVGRLAPVLLLQESVDGGGRVLPIYIKDYEAAAISRKLCAIQGDQLSTCDLVANVIAQCGRTVLRALISHIVGDVFDAALILDHETSVPAQVLDAIMIAYHVEVPILVGSQVLDQIGRPQSQMITPAGWRIDVSA